ncbi:NUDIX hydrolase [Nocardia camponoti]|nr:bifunctional NUDIX hydrolase/histidine phosphatase family protein [Nocardia camponoti]
MTTLRDPQVLPNIHAAGAVLWRERGGQPDDIEIAVIHRPKYGDWSLPKGKLDPGESPLVAAVREVGEETGLPCTLGRYLGHVTYPIPGHRKLKRVDYWAAKATTGDFVENAEVDEMRWIPLEQVMDQLSYPMDRQIVRAFTRVPADTSTILLVRHAKAGKRGSFAGPDVQRPLVAAGVEQAEALVPNLLALGASEIYSATPARCVETVTPLAKRLDVEINCDTLFSEQGYDSAKAAARQRFRSLITKDAVPVVCSQGGVIPDLVAWLADESGLAVPSARNRKGSVWALSFLGDRLVAADHMDRALSTEIV